MSIGPTGSKLHSRSPLHIQQTAIELLAIVFSAWGTTPEISQAVAEEVRSGSSPLY